jgi:hypothetical protein
MMTKPTPLFELSTTTSARSWQKGDMLRGDRGGWGLDFSNSCVITKAGVSHIDEFDPGAAEDIAHGVGVFVTVTYRAEIHYSPVAMEGLCARNRGGLDRVFQALHPESAR